MTPSLEMSGNNSMDILESAPFYNYAFYSSVLIVKMFLMTVITAVVRIHKNAFVNPEDTIISVTANKAMKKDVEKRTVSDDPHVERVRRAHQNDLENIVPFFIIGFLYCTTRPDPGVAHGLFLFYTITRVVHTLVYAVKPAPQPTRTTMFFLGMGVNCYLTVSVMIHFAGLLSF